MSFNRICAFGVIAGGTMLAACNTANSHIGDEDPGFGESIKYDQAIQTVNPLPIYPPAADQPGSNGVKGQGAVKRYRTDAVKPVEAQSSTSGSSGSGSSGSQSH